MDDPTRYFTTVVSEVLGDYLLSEGFEQRDQSPTRATYSRDATLVSFAFFVEDRPSPWVAVDVGLLDPDGSTRLAGLWRALADDEPARLYTSWRFNDRSSLTQVLRRIRSEVLAERGRSLLGSESQLRGVLAVQADEAETKYIEERRRADLQQARRAYEDGRFREAVDAYVLLDTASLSAADRRRLHEARRRTGEARPTST